MPKNLPNAQIKEILKRHPSAGNFSVKIDERYFSVSFVVGHRLTSLLWSYESMFGGPPSWTKYVDPNARAELFKTCVDQKIPLPIKFDEELIHNYFIENSRPISELTKEGSDRSTGVAHKASSIDEYEEEAEQSCPFCKQTQACFHEVLRLNLTFKEVLSGPLAEAFNGSWDRLSARDSSGEKTSEYFLKLENICSEWVDTTQDDSIEPAPGLASRIRKYFVCDLDSHAQLIKDFTEHTGRLESD